MNRFISRTLLLFPVLAGMLIVNWTIDPEHLRSPQSYERGIADMLLRGKDVTNVVESDAAAILEYSIRGQATAPDVLLLGTSKSKGINSDFFPNQTFFNAALSGGGLTDLIVIYSLYEQRGLIPHEVIIEMDPWLLEKGHISQVPRFEAARRAVEQSLASGTPVVLPDSTEPPKQNFHTFLRFLSPDYFQLSLLTLLGTLTDGRDFGRVREYHPGDSPTGTTYLTDGSVIVPEQLRANLGTDVPLADALHYGWNPPGGVPAQMDKHQMAVLETFLQRLSAQGVKIVLYLPPYHPKSYELMLASPNRVIVDIQHYFEDLARENGYGLIGSFNPADVGLTDADFYDVTHPTPDAVKRIFENAK